MAEFGLNSQNTYAFRAQHLLASVSLVCNCHINIVQITVKYGELDVDALTYPIINYISLTNM